MTDKTTADLIAEARSYVDDHDAYADSHLLRALADRLEAAEQRAEEAERDRRYETEQKVKLAAVVEKVRAEVEYRQEDSDLGVWADSLADILATAPADVLRERDAEKWDEGSETGFTHGMSYQAGSNSAMYYQNPYRAREEKS